ncbi:hypothetical protein ACGFX8_36180 [Streptomyces sp. NPDC048362]|uniref:hypothetical protein n=1 Tax=Streptomyces sp. NPDC048362 TaxID=3365539 RepID=UPI003710215E
MPALSLIPKTLASDLRSLVDAVKIAQARSMAIEAQETVGRFITDTELALHATDLQKDLKGAATQYLNDVQAELVSVIVETRNLTDVFDVVDDSAVDAASLRDELVQCSSHASEMPEVVAALSKQVETDRARLETAIKDFLAALKGKKGEIAQIKASIEATSEQLNTDLNDIMQGADAIGSTVGSFITDMFKIVTGTSTSVTKKAGGDAGKPGSGDKKTDSGKKTDGDKTTDSGKKTDGDKTTEGDDAESLKFNLKEIDFGKVKDVGLDAVGDVKKGVDKLNAGVDAYKQHMEELAQLYQDLATLEVGITVATSVNEQTKKFRAALLAVSTAVTKFAATYVSLQKDFTPALTASPSDLQRALTSAAPEWSGVGKVASRALEAISSLPESTAKLPI